MLFDSLYQQHLEDGRFRHKLQRRPSPWAAGKSRESGKDPRQDTARDPYKSHTRLQFYRSTPFTPAELAVDVITVTAMAIV